MKEWKPLMYLTDMSPTPETGITRERKGERFESKKERRDERESGRRRDRVREK